MSTEKKLEATKLLLSIMTDLVIENVNDPWRLAGEHRRRFNEATKDNPELFSAGMEIVHELGA